MSLFPGAAFRSKVNGIFRSASLYAAEKTNDYKKIVAEYLGKGKNVKDCDESQTDMLLLILDDLKDYCAENEIAL